MDIEHIYMLLLALLGIHKLHNLLHEFNYFNNVIRHLNRDVNVNTFTTHVFMDQIT